MIDLNHLEKYKENNRIEAKKALGGLPDSIWETYSAFANTFGGLILLGVEELKDRSLRAVDLPDPTYLIEEFWRIVNDPARVSVNILTEKDVYTENVNGRVIVVIHVPRAERSAKPVYIGGDMLTGTYCRSGDGDYRCTLDEILSMLRGAEIKSQDMTVLENMDTDALDSGSVRSYRERMRRCRPGHVWEKLGDDDFLYKLGAVSRGADGKRYPTAAGLLMFGREYEIVKEFPNYFLDYQEQSDDSGRAAFRIVSSSGDWSGSVYDFYFRVYDRIAQDIKLPPDSSGTSADDAPVHSALREALANCIINADYYGRQGIVIVKKHDIITFSNPGSFRIAIEDAKLGGISDPRNTALIKMFNLIGIGKRAGSGIPSIYSIWDRQGWEAPVITEELEPARITLSLSVLTEEKPFGKGRRAAINSGDKARVIELQKSTVIEYLTDHVSAGAAELAELLGARPARISELLKALTAEGIIAPEGGSRSRVYRLREK